MRVKHLERENFVTEQILNFPMRVVPRIMKIRPGTGFVPGFLFYRKILRIFCKIKSPPGRCIVPVLY